MPKLFRIVHVQSLVSPPDPFLFSLWRTIASWHNVEFFCYIGSHVSCIVALLFFMEMLCTLWNIERTHATYEILGLLISWTFPWCIRGISFSPDASGESGLKHQNAAHGREMWSRYRRSTPPRAFTTASTRHFSPDVSGQSGQKPTASQNQGKNVSTYVFV